MGDKQMTQDVATAKALLEANGFVVLRAKSYAKARADMHAAKVEAKSERRHNEHTRAWAHDAFVEQRRLAERCTYLYGLAAAHGATPEELRGCMTNPRQSVAP